VCPWAPNVKGLYPAAARSRSYGPQQQLAAVVVRPQVPATARPTVPSSVAARQGQPARSRCRCGGGRPVPVRAPSARSGTAQWVVVMSTSAFGSGASKEVRGLEIDAVAEVK